MWGKYCIYLLVVQIALLVSFFVGIFRKKRLDSTLLFFGLVSIANYLLHLLPQFYTAVLPEQADQLIFNALECITSTIKMFVGEVRTDTVNAFTSVAPIYLLNYVLGMLLALLATVNAAITAFRHRISNSLRVRRALKATVCDIVVGSSDRALAYAKESGAILIPDGIKDKEGKVRLIRKGYTVLKRNFSKDLFDSHVFNPDTKYNIICPNERELYLDYINIFINSIGDIKNVNLYVELDSDKTDTIRREMIDKSACKSQIFTFSADELLVHDFLDKHPITQYIPRDFVESDTSLRPDTVINTFVLGFNRLNREMYRQCVMNNQFVKFEDGEYRGYPINYHIYDTEVTEDMWLTGGLSSALTAMSKEKERYFEIPDMPCNTTLHKQSPLSMDTLYSLLYEVRRENSFSLVLIDTGNNYKNIETGTRLRSLLDSLNNYHIFIRCDSEYAEDDSHITYLGDADSVFTHDIIVNDKLSAMAKKINHLYTAEKLKIPTDSEDFNTKALEEAEKEWNKFSYFKRASNIYSAANIKIKLGLLGIECIDDGKGKDCSLITKKYVKDSHTQYADYFTKCMRNALAAQEHMRWNAYHLVNEFLPIEKSLIKYDEEKGKVITQNELTKRHACITTYKGLDKLFRYNAELAEKTLGKEQKVEDYECYKYDVFDSESIENLLKTLGYSIKEA